jgi:hypothetical protein
MYVSIHPSILCVANNERKMEYSHKIDKFIDTTTNTAYYLKFLVLFVTGYELCGWCPVPGRGHYIQASCWTHLASYPVNTEGSFPSVKQLECEADH